MTDSRIRTLRADRMRMKYAGSLGELPEEMRTTVERDRAEGFGWRYDGLIEWTTEEIFRKLGELGIDTDPTRFRERAGEAGRVEALEALWTGADRRPDGWADFALLAAEELWYRLLPEVECPEIASRRFDEAALAASDQYSFWITAEPARRSELWKAAAVFADYVARDSADQESTRFSEAQACSPIDYEGIVLDLLKSPGTADLEHAEKAAHMIVRVKSNPTALGFLAIALARAGHPERAQRTLEENLERFPVDCWAHEKAGEAYLLLAQPENAVECFRTALSRADTAISWGAMLDKMCNAVTAHESEAGTNTTLSSSLDQLAEEIPPPED